MPTYRNDSTSIIAIKNLAGSPIMLKPGDSVESYEIRSDSGLVKTVDTPYYNPLVDRHSVTSTGEGDDQTVSITVASTTGIKIWKVTGGPVSVFYQAKANTPAIAILRTGDSFVVEVDGNVGQLVLEFVAAGTCEVVESKEQME